jgi:hypothetical protein
LQIVKTGILLTLTCFALVSCVEEQSDPNQPCMDATAHLDACGQSTEAVFAGGCDVALAQDLLAVDCLGLENKGKSDIIANLLCRAGFYRSCAVPACENAMPEDFHEWGNCSDLVQVEGCGACDFYRCREETSVGLCGGDGYYLGFGYEYCRRYRQVTEPHFSPEGQIWSAQTRRCLMETLDAEIPDGPNCDGLIQAGYASHPSCYLGTGFCDLPALDWVRIVNTIDFDDLDFELMSEVIRECTGN